MKHKLIELKEDIDKPNSWKSQYPPLRNACNYKIKNKDIENMDTINQKDLTEIYITLHQTQ